MRGIEAYNSERIILGEVLARKNGRDARGKKKRRKKKDWERGRKRKHFIYMKVWNLLKIQENMIWLTDFGLTLKIGVLVFLFR